MPLAARTVLVSSLVCSLPLLLGVNGDGNIPPWAVTALAALIGFAGSWGALRITVSSSVTSLRETISRLEKDIGDLRVVIAGFAQLQATLATIQAKLDGAGQGVQHCRERIQEMSEKLHAIEIRDAHLHARLFRLEDLAELTPLPVTVDAGHSPSPVPRRRRGDTDAGR